MVAADAELGARGVARLGRGREAQQNRVLRLRRRRRCVQTPCDLAGSTKLTTGLCCGGFHARCDVVVGGQVGGRVRGRPAPSEASLEAPCDEGFRRFALVRLGGRGVAAEGRAFAGGSERTVRASLGLRHHGKPVLVELPILPPWRAARLLVLGVVVPRRFRSAVTCSGRRRNSLRARPQTGRERLILGGPATSVGEVPLSFLGGLGCQRRV